jgi:hypothetical protein
MAGNNNAPFGFRQWSGTGSAPTYEQVTVGPGGIAGGIASNAAAIFYGDPVVRGEGGASTLVQAAGSAGTGTVTLAGVFQGCKYLSTANKRTTWSNFWPGSDVSTANAGATEAYIINDPNAKFLAQSDSTGLATADIASNLDFNIGTGSTANGISGAFLIHGGAVSAAYPFRFYDLVWAPPGANGVSLAATAAPFNYAIVAFNNVETRTIIAPNT